MRNLIIVLGAVLMAVPALADVVWDQLTPIDVAGALSVRDYDVYPSALHITLDDFTCTESGPITQIDFYGYSTAGSGQIESFRFLFFTNVPAEHGDAAKPGDFLYEYTTDPGAWQEVETQHFRVTLPENQWFAATAGNIYWIAVQGVMVEDMVPSPFYWAFRERHEPTLGGDAAFGSETFAVPPWSNWGCPPGYADPDWYEGMRPAGWTGLDMSFQLYGAPVVALTGDLNCDGLINTFDIDPFVLALTAPTAYALAYPDCRLLNADINCDGVVNTFDIDPFVLCLTGGGCPPCP